MRIRRAVALLSIFPLLAVSLPAAASKRTPGPRCGVKHHPSRKITYTPDQMKGTFRFDEHCLTKDTPFHNVLVFLMQRENGRWRAVWGEGESCAAGTRCLVTLKYDHLPVEVATYRFNVYFADRRNRTVKLKIGPFDCYSTLVLASCE